jgi:DNA-binding NarL/FixJ family response regulator
MNGRPTRHVSQYVMFCPISGEGAYDPIDGSASETHPGRQSANRAPRLTVGRERERETLERALDRLCEGAAQAVVLTGDPGIGKTYLLGFLADRALDREVTVLTGRACEPGRRVPFGVLIDALDDHLGAMSHGELARIGADHLRLLGAVFPSLSRYDTRPVGPVLRAGRLHAAVRALLEAAAEAGLVVELDDMHWADEESVEVVAQLLRRPPRAPVLLALAYRDRQAPEWLRSTVADAAVSHAITTLKLGPLGESEAARLAATLGTHRWQHALYEKSGGNPFYLLALASSPMPHQDNGRQGDDELPMAVEAVLLAELMALSPAARLLAQAAAVVDEPFDLEDAAAVAEFDTPPALRAVDELVERDLIRPVSGTRDFTFRHPLIRQAAYRGAAPGWRLGAHSRAARVLERRGASTTARARHVALAARLGDFAAVELLTNAAREIRFRAPATAAEWLRAALHLLPHRSHEVQRATLLLYLAQSLGVAGHPRQSRDTMQEALRLLPRDQIRMRAKAVASCALMDRTLGQLREAQALLINEIASLPHQEAIEAAELKFELACGELIGGDAVAAGKWAAQALAVTTRHQASALRAAALGAMAMASTFREDVPAAMVYLRSAEALLDSLLDDELVKRLDAAVWVSMAEVFFDRYADALRHLGRALRLARSTGQGMVLPYLLAVRVLALRSTGRLIDASACAEDAADSALLTGSDEQRVLALSMRCWISAWTGDLDAALCAGNDAVEGCDRDITPWIAAFAFRVLGEARLAANDPEGCLALTEVIGGADLPRADPWSRVGWYELLTRAALAAGYAEAAADWAKRGSAAAARLELEGRSGLALLAHAHAQAARAPAEAFDLALAAQRVLTTAGMVLDAERARLIAGRALAARGKPDLAAAELRRAQAAFETRGARPLARLAATERRRLAAYAARAKPGASGIGLDTLTDREKQVAYLVAEGQTNRQIARQLQVTEKTVEMHLSKIFAKLGVSSRAAVASAVVAAKPRSAD